MRRLSSIVVLSIVLGFFLLSGACGRPGESEPQKENPKKEVVVTEQPSDTNEKPVTVDSKDAGTDAPVEPKVEQVTDRHDAGAPDTPVKDTTVQETGPEPTQETIPEKPTACNNTPAPGPDPCTVTAGNKAILFQANILTPQGIMEQGQVLVDDKGKITCVACDCTAQATGATRVSCAKAVLSPGLINGHDHIGWATKSPAGHGTERYEHRHDWRKGKGGHTSIPQGQSDTSSEGSAWGELRMMLGGATSMVGSGGTSGLIRNLDRDRGGLPGVLKYTTFPLGDSSGTKRETGCTGYKIDNASDLSKYTAYYPHVSEGIDKAANNEFICVSSSQNGAQQLTSNKSAFIHAVGLTAPDVSQMALTSTALIWSARTNIDLYGHTALAPMYDRMGVLIALGTDWPLSGSMNVLRELQCFDYLNKQHFNNYFSSKKLFDMATINGAKASHTEQLIGSIKVGLFADLTLFDGTNNNGYRAVIDAKPQDIHLVLVGGKILYGTASIVNTALPSASADCEDIDVCTSKKRICIKTEKFSSKTSSYAALKTLLEDKGKNASTPYTIYPLFFCGAPKDEPSCVPFRKGEYGQSNPNDKDGDGVEDSKDNCPNQFNPIRPMDDGKQADFDKDGVGDACDPCPLTANSTTCKKVDPNDRDADGIKDNVDNCPGISNPKQEDRDKDKIGDACDPCPDDANPAGQACPAKVTMIYDIKQNKIAKDTEVKLENVLITAMTARKDRVIVQHKQGDKGYNGVDYSGIIIYLGDTKLSPKPQPVVGTRITVQGFVSDYNGQIQINKVNAFTAQTATEALPAPVVVKVSEINDKNATRSAKLEGVIVQIAGVEVTNKNPDAPSDFGEWSVAETAAKTISVRIDDLFDTSSYTGAIACYWNTTPPSGDDSYCLGTDKCQCPTGVTCTKGTKEAKCFATGGTPAPDKRTVGDKFQSITGILQFSFGNYKIAPRDTADLKK